MAATDNHTAAGRPEVAAVVRTVTLPPSFEAPARSRRLLRDLADAIGPVEWLETGELACTELVTNAVLHAHTAIEVVARATATDLQVEVRDGNAVVPVQRSYDSLATTGRGMALVAALVSEYGISDAGPDGKTAWFAIHAGQGVPPDEVDLLAVWDDSAAAAAWESTTPSAAAPDPGTAVRPPAGHAQGVSPSGLWVNLLRLPPTLWLAAQQHHDALLRELALYLGGHDVDGVDLTATDLARSRVFAAVQEVLDAAGRTHDVRPALPAGHPTPLPWVPEPFDLALFVPSGTTRSFAAMQDTLDAAERLAVAGELLARPGLPEVVAVRDWVCEQVIGQDVGGPAQPWPGTDDPRFTVHPAWASDVSDWDLDLVRTSERAVVAADDSNRIVAVSPALARLVGWDADELPGRRIVTLVPARLREAHVAGFTRHLTTGTSHILGVPVSLPVLCHDGSEIDCQVLIDTVPAHRGHRYLAYLTPDDAPGPPSS